MRNRRWLRWAAAGLAGMALGGPWTAAAVQGTGAVQAATTGKYAMTVKSITFNGTLVARPQGFTYQGTAYFPAWYVMRALQGMQVKSSWDGHNWKLTIPAGIPVDLSNVQVGTGNVAIYINGTLVKRINSLVAADPASGVPTVYIPVWYAMRVFDRLHVQSAWDGTHWMMVWKAPGSSSPSASGGSGSGSSGAGSGGGTASSGSGASSGAGASSGSAQGGSSGSGNTGGSPETAPPPPDTTPQASSVPGAVSKGTLTADLVAALGWSTAQAPASSPYDDVPAGDALWPAVATAVAHQLVQPFSSAHFGRGDVVTLTQAEQMVYNGLQLGSLQDQPGGTLAAWADACGLTQGVTQAGLYLSQADEQQLVSNLKRLLAGGALSGGVFHVAYTPEDEAAWTFSGAASAFASSSDIQQAILNTYQFFNSITARVQNGDLIITLPVSRDARWFAFAAAPNGVEYSLDGGNNWQPAAQFDGSQLTNQPANVLLRVPIGIRVDVTYNVFVPQTGGSVSLGWVALWTDGSGQIHAQRISLL
ncbi:MAG: hypothetical protein K6T26_02395 [Alicyclobacillus sp.]|nr:hypothetical protein [Alicyclobacillus sp.]